ncbi:MULTISPECIES: hypothetical protein [unclassified Streptomyces]|uniref:hypothetical protein n=1 Tax=unclassified Streptomyces TaxID=2593676 RepID=UPI00234AD229|nr:hypothetical protein [Streptomyces sp. M92]WCN05571.1 hypothetical protein M6G08_27775 [Streptomyces sp. M92]
MSDPSKDTSQKRTTTRTAEVKASGVADKAGDAASAARAGTRRSAEAANGAVQTAAKGVAAGRQAVVTTSGRMATGARTAWTVIAHRKLVAAGVGAGVTALSAASYAVGRRAGRHSHGPLTRLTGGRI